MPPMTTHRDVDDATRMARGASTRRLYHVHATIASTSRAFLRLEEGLLRHRAREDWLTTLDGAERDAPSCLGVSGAVERLVDAREARRRGAKLVRRFTGGRDDRVRRRHAVRGDDDERGRRRDGAASARRTREE